MSNTQNHHKRLANKIRMCGELACLLEVSATPKPGNVHRFRDFEDIRYEDFLASSISFGPFLEELALKGILLKEGKIDWNELNLGLTIKNAIQQSDLFHKRGNTNLGIILLLAPLAVAAGMTIDFQIEKCDENLVRDNVIEIMLNTTIEDAIHVSDGIALTQPGGLGNVEKFDVNSPSLHQELKEEGITLLQLMHQCKERDNICLELSEEFPITFDFGLRTLNRSFMLSKDINLAIIDSYLDILAHFPDTLISRKFGSKQANDISLRAKSIINLGGALTIDGRRELEEFDIELREEEEKINPGTTADLVASTVFIFLLTGASI
ncbi:MAG: ATP--dephospho-CoA triphosphoribosyl transferase CitG [Candidatus Heimdallarchaeota archaeon]|nr:ATP--dephospho-CoA triphosphoribosyl transferase CitG [Candidatus Heimdallarchaeota archaeon]